MKIPADILAKHRQGAPAFWVGDVDDEGTVDWSTVPASYAFVPPGFLPWNALDFGNGDTYGYYWPIGREDLPPVICTTEHDVWAVLPNAGDFHGLMKRLYATQYVAGPGEDPEEVEDTFAADEIEGWAADYEIELPVRGSLFGTAEQESGALSRSRAQDLLDLDPNNPRLFLDLAQEEMAALRYSSAEFFARNALSLFPEYSDALFVLLKVVRHQLPARADEFGPLAVSYLAMPDVFGFRQQPKQVLEWLQRLPDSEHPFIGHDPIWVNRKRLTLATGVKTNEDFAVYDEAFGVYKAQMQWIQVIYLRMRVAELMQRETISFRERYGWSEEGYRAQLREDYIAAGLMARVPVLDAV